MTDPTPGPGDSGSFRWPPTSSGRQQRTHVWGSEIPFRNEYFIGREAELSALREQLVGGGPAVIRQPPRALYGLGGVGKTQIATEYAHRFADDYEVVWWVRSDQEDTILASLVSLGTQLRIPEVSPGDRDRSLRLVLNALQSGDPYARWLLIFDDVTQPQKLRRYIPQGGHVIVTSRITEWRNVLSTDGIEVKEFARADTVQFLRTRVPQLAVTGDASSDAEAARHAGRLAEALGDLPLAAEHAAAFLSQTGGPVSDYIDAFKADAHTLLAQDADMLTTSVAVSTTWTVARPWLSPEARELFQLLAFFAAEPIAEENLLHAERTTLDPALPGPLRKVLTSRAEMKRAQRELARYSFISVYGARNVAQLHRVVQAVTESRIRRENPELAALLKKTVFSLLAATDPDAPEREANDVIYPFAVGAEAKRMIGRTPSNIQAIRPLKDGVIADFEICEMMLRYFIRKVHPRRFSKPRMVICVPSGITGVEKRAVQEAAEYAGARKAYIIEEPMAAAIGAGLPIHEPTGNMVVDIGGGTTEVAVISLGGIVTSQSIRIGGDELDEAIISFVKKEYSLALGDRTAEEIKMALGSACDLEEELHAEIRGRDLVSGLPKTVITSTRDIRRAIEEPVAAIVDAVKITLDKTPPELSADIMTQGIVLTGGGALLHGLDVRLQAETNMPIVVAPDPLNCVALGSSMCLEEFEALRQVLISSSSR